MNRLKKKKKQSWPTSEPVHFILEMYIDFLLMAVEGMEREGQWRSSRLLPFSNTALVNWRKTRSM